MGQARTASGKFTGKPSSVFSNSTDLATGLVGVAVPFTGYITPKKISSILVYAMLINISVCGVNHVRHLAIDNEIAVPSLRDYALGWSKVATYALEYAQQVNNFILSSILRVCKFFDSGPKSGISCVIDLSKGFAISEAKVGTPEFAKEMTSCVEATDDTFWETFVEMALGKQNVEEIKST